MSNYFEGSLYELEKRTPEITTRFRKTDANHFTAIIYSNGQISSKCEINDDGNFLGSGIYYSPDISSHGHSPDHSISIKDDGYTLYLALGWPYNSGDENKLTQEGASEHLWETLIKPLQ